MITQPIVDRAIDALAEHYRHDPRIADFVRAHARVEPMTNSPRPYGYDVWDEHERGWRMIWFD